MQLTFPGVIRPFSSASVIILYPILQVCDNAKSEKYPIRPLQRSSMLLNSSINGLKPNVTY